MPSDKIMETLFGSKAKVLKLFFQRPALMLSAEDIGKKTGLKSGRLKPVIGDLIKLGVLKKVNGNGKTKKTKTKKS